MPENFDEFSVLIIPKHQIDKKFAASKIKCSDIVILSEKFYYCNNRNNIFVVLVENIIQNSLEE